MQVATVALLVLGCVLGTLKANIIEIETFSANITCVEDVFSEGEPLSVAAFIHQTVRNDFVMKLFIQTSDGERLEMADFDHATKKALLVYNMPFQQLIQICVENYESQHVFVELDIKAKHFLAVEDSAPKLAEYAQIDDKLEAIVEGLNKAQRYLSETEKFQLDISTKVHSMFSKFNLYVLLLIISMVVIALVQVKLVRMETERKKLG